MCAKACKLQKQFAVKILQKRMQTAKHANYRSNLPNMQILHSAAKFEALIEAHNGLAKLIRQNHFSSFCCIHGSERLTISLHMAM
jgi:hypothetical protein